MHHFLCLETAGKACNVLNDRSSLGCYLATRNVYECDRPRILRNIDMEAFFRSAICHGPTNALVVNRRMKDAGGSTDDEPLVCHFLLMTLWPLGR